MSKIIKVLQFPVLLLLLIPLYWLANHSVTLISGGQEYLDWYWDSHSNKPFIFWFYPGMMIFVEWLLQAKMRERGESRLSRLRLRVLVWIAILTYGIIYSKIGNGFLDVFTSLSGAPN